jgi:hypothetical protein
MKDCASRDGVLVAAGRALIETRAGHQMVNLATLALVAGKAVRPFQVSKGLDTGCLVFILVTESKKAGHVDSSINPKLSQFYGVSTNLDGNS